MCVAELWSFNGNSVDCWQLNSSLLVAVGGSFVIPEYGVHSAKVVALLCLNIANIQQRYEKCVHIVSQSVAERYFLGI